MTGPPAAEGPERAARPNDLPEFDRPPVVETVLGVSFDELPILDTVLLARFADRLFEEGFNEIGLADPYHAPLELFGDEVGATIAPIAVGPPPRRHLFSKDNDVVQVQRDWFAYNWRKTPSREQYERYETGRQKFAEYYRLLSEFLSAQTGEELQPTQCEITYVNHVDAIHTGASHQVGDLLNSLSIRASEHLPYPEEVSFDCSYKMESIDGLLGRLHVEVRFGSNEQQPTSLILTARGAPPTLDREGILNFLNQGRIWIVQAFSDLTSQEMHNRWEKQPTRGKQDDA